MARSNRVVSTDRVERMLGNLLRIGVIVAAMVVLAGGILYLKRHGAEIADKRVFRGEPADLQAPAGIVADACRLSSRGIMQLGLLQLIATPIARVILSVCVFLRQRDYLYVLLTFVVLGVLLFSLFFSQSGP